MVHLIHPPMQRTTDSQSCQDRREFLSGRCDRHRDRECGQLASGESDFGGAGQWRPSLPY